MTIKLTTQERLMARFLVPQTGGLITLKLAKDILEKIEFSGQEIETLNMEDMEEGRVKWSIEKAKYLEPFTLNFTKKEIDIIKKRIDELDKEEKLPLNLYDLAVKFMDAK